MDYKFRAWEFGKMYYQVRVGGMFDGEATAPTTWTGSDWVNLTGGECTKVMQYSGVNDINKKECYLGDIIRYRDSIGVIIFKDGCFEIDWVINKDFFTDRLGVFKDVLEIIGNKFEDEELIKKGV